MITRVFRALSVLTRYKYFQYRGSNFIYYLLVIFSRLYRALFVDTNYIVVPCVYGKLILPKTGYAANRVITLITDLVEPQWKRHFENVIKKANVMIDIGAAADGYYSIKACSLNPNIFVVAVEPLFSELYWLLNNIKLNKLDNRIKA